VIEHISLVMSELYNILYFLCRHSRPSVLCGGGLLNGKPNGKAIVHRAPAGNIALCLMKIFCLARHIPHDIANLKPHADPVSREARHPSPPD